MKSIGVLLALIILTSCATTTRFDQTCITCVQSQRIACKGTECPTSFMVGNECFVTMVETGENIFLNDILKEEKIEPRGGINFTIAKVNGRYFLVGENFKFSWVIAPKSKNLATIKAVEMPALGFGIPSFELYDKQLKMVSQDKNLEFIYDDDKDKWIDVKSAKVGG